MFVLGISVISAFATTHTQRHPIHNFMVASNCLMRVATQARLHTEHHILWLKKGENTVNNNVKRNGTQDTTMSLHKNETHKVMKT